MGRVLHNILPCLCIVPHEFDRRQCPLSIQNIEATVTIARGAVHAQPHRNIRLTFSESGLVMVLDTGPKKPGYAAMCSTLACALGIFSNSEEADCIEADDGWV